MRILRTVNEPAPAPRPPHRLANPAAACAALTALVRGLTAWQAWSRNPAAAHPRLDGAYYMEWAADIARGDVLGRGGTIGGEPFLLNPLYPYVIAPLVRIFGETTAPVLALQVVLAAATAGLAAAAARRFSGNAAAWIAGLATAFSASLAHLDANVAISGLAAFLVAGTCFACAPGGGRGHGPVAAGVWLGLSALARPVALFAIPFVAWLFARRAEGRRARVRAALLVAAPVALLAALPFVRNAAVSGEAVVYTASNGLNLHLGNNPAARRQMAMQTDDFRFEPREMYDDTKYRVAMALGREPTRSEISSWYAGLVGQEWREHFAASAAWHANKLRWFFGPVEAPSSADIRLDRVLVPWLAIAWLPTWLLAALALGGAVACRDRRDLLLGPGAVVLAHVVVCTLAFPQSHYRAPAVPAMAVLAACGLVAAATGLSDGRRGPAATLALASAVAAIAGFVPPQPLADPETAALVSRGVESMHRGDADAALRDGAAALARQPDRRDALVLMMDACNGRHDWAGARTHAARLVEIQPWSPHWARELAMIDLELGHRGAAFALMDRQVTAFPWSGRVRGYRGEVRAFAGDLNAAGEDLLFALDHDYRPADWALQRAGIRR
jgi:4-amino-4-deoxy-L-arabinose transferase-like glycosyltransferase